MRRALLTASLLLFLGCGGESPPTPLELPREPQRVAVQDRAVRRLMTAVGEHEICGRLQGRLLPLPEEDRREGAEVGLSPVTGRLLVESCRSERDESGLSLHLGGRGWSWVRERRSGPLASSFLVEGYLRFQVAAALQGTLDLNYDEAHQIATVWFTPTAPPTATFTPVGRVPIAPDGPWSGLLGTIGQVLAGPLDQQARPLIEQHGAAIMSRRLGRGLTATVDLCTGQPDLVLTALPAGVTPQRPYDAAEGAWLANERVRLREGGIDLSGPFGQVGESLRVDAACESGPGFELWVLCRDEAQQAFEAFLADRSYRPVVSVAYRSYSLSGPAEPVVVNRLSCPVNILLAPLPGATDVELRYRIVRPGARGRPLVHCSPSH